MDKGVKIRYNGRSRKLLIAKDLRRFYIVKINVRILLSGPIRKGCGLGDSQRECEVYEVYAGK